jgi:hypothetical protein
LFLPGPEPIEIESSTGGGGQEESPAGRFDRLMTVEPKDVGAFVKFIELSAGANSMTIDEVKKMALDNLDEFRSNFNKWKSSKDQEEEKTEDPEAAFMAEWKRLQKSGFRKYVDENIDLFRSCSEETLKAAKQK